MSEITFSEAINKALSELFTENDDVFLMGEDIGVYGGAFGVTRGLLEKHGPVKLMETPISEAGFTGVAVGAALMGSRPIVEIMFMDFITLCVDQLVNQAAKIRYLKLGEHGCPLVVRVVSGGGRGYGPTHSQNLEAFFTHTPGLCVYAPSTVQDAYLMLKQAVYLDDPVVFLEHKLLYKTKGSIKEAGVKALPKKIVPKLVQEGEDLTIVSYSYMTVEVLKAAKALEENDVSVEVIDLRCLSPLDDSLIIESVEKTGRVIIVAEDNQSGGIASEISARIAEKALDYLDAPIKRVCAPDCPIPASAPLEKAALPYWKDICEAAQEVLSE